MFSASARLAAAAVRSSSASSVRASASTASASTTSASANKLRTGNNRVDTTAKVQRRFMGGGGGDMPVPQSQTAPLWHGHTVAKEGWETTIYFYYAAGILLQAAVLMGAPETSIESWARPEAQARLVLKAQNPAQEFEFGTHYQDLMAKQNLDLWSQFAARAVTPGEDDDDDDDEDDDDEDDDDDE
eukprot:CAMPEP_0113462822 /NCGR_PEP_ID=MMETSP0014_2-20120614/12312_1 /TAXON_ID=2857 /ORGANISM="Nitzschia sp." /LENGTH=185 /DNA_ID=CAMNT_0000354741 /DNA_START=249 /DNA_END=806 /DNA_ORIENTATION=- /assembly_acc=CAM_ASM_000159